VSDRPETRPQLIEEFLPRLNSPHGRINGPTARLGGLLASALAGQSASKAAMVEVPGIEPGSSVASSGLLRAQSATSLLGSTGHADQPV
jgi:hypothetical protein